MFCILGFKSIPSEIFMSEVDLYPVIVQELAEAGFRTLSDLSNLELQEQRLVHPSRMADYNHVNGCDLAPLIELMSEFSTEFDGELNLTLKASVALPALAIDCRVYKGSLFSAVYFAKNKNIEQVCLNSGFKFSKDKKIWFKKAELPGESLHEITHTNHMILGEFLINLRNACSVVIIKSNLEKFYLSKMAV